MQQAKDTFELPTEFLNTSTIVSALAFGCPWNEWTCESAAQEDHLEGLL